ncbi:hypothetical protein C1X73_11425 [Pseudomonas sp. FW305-130]|nr:hypothetical protein C1X74_07895 [Pseudomonas sp. GW460-5]PNB59166.1 hypothetical protein C1X73_11425 [Pseudomonas sp. FW305-130]
MLSPARPLVGAGKPAKQAARWMARASPVFAGMPAPTVIAKAFRCEQDSCSHKVRDSVSDFAL